jgi:hypothetical protein
MTTPDEKPSQTQVINLEDVDVSAIASERALPPPLPPELPSQPSVAPSPVSLPPPSPPPRSGMFYGLLIVGFIVVGLAGGVAAIVLLRAPEPPPEPEAAPAPSAAVMTLPTIDMNDDVDGGS